MEGLCKEFCPAPVPNPVAGEADNGPPPFYLRARICKVGHDLSILDIWTLAHRFITGIRLFKPFQMEPSRRGQPGLSLASMFCVGTSQLTSLLGTGQ